jgi:hypothetical protein
LCELRQIAHLGGANLLTQQGNLMASCKATYNGSGQPDRGAIRKAFGEMQQKQPSWQLQMMDDGFMGVTFRTGKEGVSTKELCDFVIPYFRYDDFTISPQG